MAEQKSLEVDSQRRDYDHTIEQKILARSSTRYSGEHQISSCSRLMDDVVCHSLKSEAKNPPVAGTGSELVDFGSSSSPSISASSGLSTTPHKDPTPFICVADVEACAFPSCMRPPPLLPTASVAVGFPGSGEGVAWGLRQKLSVTR